MQLTGLIDAQIQVPYSLCGVRGSKVEGHKAAQQVSFAVSAPSEAWRFLRGESPLWVRTNHQPIPSVAIVRKVVQEERTEPNEAVEAYTGNHIARKGDRNPPSLI